MNILDFDIISCVDFMDGNMGDIPMGGITMRFLPHAKKRHSLMEWETSMYHFHVCYHWRSHRMPVVYVP